MTAKTPHNCVLQGDCIAQMAQLPPASVDMLFADPPYNLQLSATLHRPDESRVRGVEEGWDKFSSFADYDKFTRAWLTQARRVLKPNGTVWVIGSYHNIFRLGTALQDLGYWLLNDVIWQKSNPMPNFRGRRFTNAHETLIWASHSAKSRYTFNYHALKTANDDVQMRSDWHIPLCTGGERLRDSTGAKIHPTQKPEALLQRVILASTKAGDVILDPFFGTGTTGVVAKRLRRHYIGIEQDKAYIAAAQTRLANTRALASADVELMPAPHTAPRVPFLHLLESGMIKPGTKLCDNARRYTARVRADGSLKVAGENLTGSIHQTGAQLQNSRSCNGWTFWHLADKSALVPLSALREKVRLTAPSGASPNRA